MWRNISTLLICIALHFVSGLQNDLVNQKVNEHMVNYIELIGNNIEKIENKELKSDIEDLFKQFIPGLEQILSLENTSKKLSLIHDILPELHKIEQLLNIVNNVDTTNGNEKDKKYRIDDANANTAVDKDILLTIYEHLEEKDNNKSTSSLPPWFPKESDMKTTTKRPYQVLKNGI